LNATAYHYQQLPEHLRNYHKVWLEVRNTQDSLEEHRDVCKALRTSHTKRLSNMPVLTSTPPVPLSTAMQAAEKRIPTQSHPHPSRRVTGHEPANPAKARSEIHSHFYGTVIAQKMAEVQQKPKNNRTKSTNKRPSPDENDETGKLPKKRARRSCTNCHRTDCQAQNLSSIKPCEFPKV
jgi:hypothetical protein